MNLARIAAAALAGTVIASPAWAADDCPSSAVCASNPAGVVSTLQTLGYKATLGKSEATGNPKISTSASGYDYDIFFYGCTNGAKCSSIGFMVTYEKDPVNSAELANVWNRDKRFSAMSFDPTDGTLSISYDVSTVGGINQVNFADVVDWWETMLGQARTFFKDHPAPDGKK